MPCVPSTASIVVVVNYGINVASSGQMLAATAAVAATCSFGCDDIIVNMSDRALFARQARWGYPVAGELTRPTISVTEKKKKT